MTTFGLASKTSTTWNFGKQSLFPWEKVTSLCSCKAKTAEPSYEVCRNHKLKSQEETTEVETENSSHSLPEAVKILSDTESEEGDETASEEEISESKKGGKSMTATGPMGLQGLNRAEMERQRLERLKRVGTGQTSSEPPAKKARVEHISTAKKTTENVTHHMRDGMEYPNGTIKWTFANGYPVESHHVTIEQVLQKHTLKAAVLSAFQVTSIHPLTNID